MPQEQDQLLGLLTSSPACYHCAADAPYKEISNDARHSYHLVIVTISVIPQNHSTGRVFCPLFFFFYLEDITKTKPTVLPGYPLINHREKLKLENHMHLHIINYSLLFIGIEQTAICQE